MRRSRSCERAGRGHLGPPAVDCRVRRRLTVDHIGVLRTGRQLLHGAEYQVAEVKIRLVDGNRAWRFWDTRISGAW